MNAKGLSAKTGSEISQLVKKMTKPELEMLNDEINILEDSETDPTRLKRLQRAGWLVYEEVSNRH